MNPLQTRRPWLLLILVSLFVFQVAPASSPGQQSTGKPKYLQHIRTPSGTPFPDVGKPVVVAIVDDGVRLTHQDLADLIYSNDGEIAGNGVDDDDNGYTDDIHGWDVADADNRVSPPSARMDDYYHGTHLAGIIARIGKEIYGDRVRNVLRILPVKALADQATTNHIRAGYQGIDYAVRSGADIVLCAWTGGQMSPEEAAILQNARSRGVLLVSSAGNFPEEREQYPAAHEAVLAVAAVDSAGKKAPFSNYGMFVDLAAPGIGIDSASSSSDTGIARHDGTSQAAAMVAAAAAIVKIHNPSFTPEMVTACLKSGADILDVANPEYTGKLGAGLLNVGGALGCPLFSSSSLSENLLQAPQGYLRYTQQSVVEWKINMLGSVKGLWVEPAEFNGDPDGCMVSFSGQQEERRLGPFSMAEFTEPMFLPGSQAIVTVEPGKGGKTCDLLLAYRTEPFNFRTLYCRGTAELEESGAFEDGSGDKPYSAGTDCKWYITAPPGNNIHFSFSEFDTEANTDLLYFFNGSGTHEKIMAVFSGQQTPPEFTTWSNHVLVWFVTNEAIQGKGWKGRYDFVKKDVTEEQ